MARYWSTPINNVPKILEAETHEETNSLIIHLTGWHVHCIHNVGLISIQIKGINKTVEIKLMATRFPTNLKIVKSTVVKNHQKLSHAKNIILVWILRQKLAKIFLIIFGAKIQMNETFWLIFNHCGIIAWLSNVFWNCAQFYGRREERGIKWHWNNRCCKSHQF